MRNGIYDIQGNAQSFDVNALSTDERRFFRAFVRRNGYRLLRRSDGTLYAAKR